MLAKAEGAAARTRASYGAACILLLSALASGACSVPFLRPLHRPETVIKDDRVVGTWSSEGEMRVRAVVAKTDGAAYAATLDVWYEKEHKATLTADLWLVRLGAATFADLLLDKKTRDRLVQSHGLLIVPMHQIFRLELDGDTLEVRSLDVDWLEKALRGGVVSLPHTFQPTEDGEIPVVTAATDEIERFFRENVDRAEAFDDATIFTRVKAARD